VALLAVLVAVLAVTVRWWAPALRYLPILVPLAAGTAIAWWLASDVLPHVHALGG
jgi:MFS superfamily sulfate permease-like transporter